MEKKTLRFALLLLCGLFVVIGIHRATHGDAATEIAEPGVTVYIFLAEDCPISQSATLVLKQLHHEYARGKIKFAGVFANAASNEASVAQFQKKYELPFPVQLDGESRLMKSLGARVTPETFVVDHSSQRVLYKGRIDNSFAHLGQRRQVITAHELQDALAAISKGHAIAVKETQAIGCFITPRK